MKKILAFVCAGLICVFGADAATRGERVQNRTKNTQATGEKIQRATTNNVRSTNTKSTNVTASRSAKKQIVQTRPETVTSRTVSKQPTRTIMTRSTTSQKRQNVTARATTMAQNASETRTGTEYEQCKTAFFTCMDQFCALKNDNFRRCSCSDRVYKFQEIFDTYQQVNAKLTEFSENLDVVGMTREQALAMKTASAGEDALTEDKSASKQLLQAIMNAIKGDDASVGGKYKDLNSVSIASDVSNAFGLDDTGQIIASYNGATLYKAVYPKCRTVVQEDCNSASLQRAINAYLMTIEQDCNTVESALQAQKKTLNASAHEGSAMLDLARVENRQKHNSDDAATCITNIEKAITNEDICGENYHKCLDYGQFIDVSTGAPLTGVVDFYKLAELLTFKTAENLDNQKLSSIANNRKFVQFFENKTKKFAESALDKCSEQSGVIWQQYLDKALLDIYYAQQSKVKEIQQSCFDLITACYTNQSTAITSAMANLTGDTSILLKPATIELTSQLCSNYIDSCNNMFGENVIKTYLANKDSTDSETACRAIAQQCFDKFGGTGYENFYYLQSGLFNAGEAIDWFTLYDETDNNNILSPCAQELYATEGCSNSELLEKVFGGFNKKQVQGEIIYTVDTDNDDRKLRPYGVASEVYTKIIDNLATQCAGIKGYFVEHQYAKQYGYKPDSFCNIDTSDMTGIFYINPVYNSIKDLNYWYRFIEYENMCPVNYAAKIDVQSWGACSCWENGGYRSKNGTSETCMPLLPIANTNNSSDPLCSESLLAQELSSNPSENQWCQQSVTSSLGQLCPTTFTLVPENTSYVFCAYKSGDTLSVIDVVLNNVSNHKISETESTNTSNVGTNYVFKPTVIINDY